MSEQKKLSYERLSLTTVSPETGSPMFTKDQVQVMHKTVAKGTSMPEFIHFLQVASATKLNPFLKEIWCYKDKKDNLIMFAGRDGFLKSAQSNPAFAGIRSAEVCENDTFAIDVANNKIKHEVTDLENRGKITGAYAIAFRKDGEPTIEMVKMSTYNKKYNTWGTHPAEMIKKVAEIHALKKAFGLSALQAQEDFEVRGDKALPLGSPATNDNVTDDRMSDTMGKAYEALLHKIQQAPSVAKLNQIAKQVVEQQDLNLLAESAIQELMEAMNRRTAELEAPEAEVEEVSDEK